MDDEPTVKKDRKQDFFGYGFDTTEGTNNTIDFEPTRGSKPKPQPNFNFTPQPQQVEPRQEDRERLEEDRRRRMQQEQARRERLRSNVNTMKLNNPQTIIEMENEPAYLRRGVKLDNVPHSYERTNSSWTIDEHDELKASGNSFLHDNVD